MTTAPKSLLDARAYLRKPTGLPDVALGIVGSQGHKRVGTSYHLGADDLDPNAYSNRTERDRAGLSNAASALDIGWFEDIIELTVWLMVQAKTGNAPDIREIIGPTLNGRAVRWDDLSGWRPQFRSEGDSHEWHLHISYYRDAEKRDKVKLFRRFFDQVRPGSSAPRQPHWTERAVNRLPLLQQGSKGPHVRTLQGLLHARGHRNSKIDGDFGPRTKTAVRAAQRNDGIVVDGIVGPQTWPKLLGV